MCLSLTQDIVCTNSFTRLIISVIFTFLLTCISTFVLSSLLCFGVLRKYFNVQAQKKQLRVAHEIEPTETMYEMENAENKAEAVYEVMNYDREVNYKENAVYAIKNSCMYITITHDYNLQIILCLF